MGKLSFKVHPLFIILGIYFAFMQLAKPPTARALIEASLPPAMMASA